MQRHTAAALVAALCVFPAAALAETRSLDVAEFHGVDVSTGIDAVVSGGTPHSVNAEAADARALDDLRYVVRDGILYLWFDWNILDLLSRPERNVRVTIGSEVLDDLTASAGASIQATGMMGEKIDLSASSGASINAVAIEGMQYEIESSSGARVEASGLCTEAEIDVSSGASVGAKDLACTRVELDVSSGASLEATATGSVDAEVSSGGHATIHGKPSIDHLGTSSGGSVNFPS